MTRQPIALWSASLSFGSYMAAYCCLLSFLTLYLLHIGYSESLAYSVFAVFGSLVWTLPLLGGAIASRIDYRVATLLGSLMTLIAVILLAVSPASLFPALGLFLVGNALYSPSLWCLLDFVYAKGDARREAGFTWFYMLFNMGAIIGIFVGGYLQAHFSYQVLFAVSILYLLGSVIASFWLLRNYQPHGSRVLSQKPLHLKHLPLWIVSVVIVSYLVTLLLQYPSSNTLLQILLAIGAIAVVLWVALRQPTTQARNKVLAFLVLTLIALCYWALYNLEPSLLSVFIEKYVNRTIGSWTIPAGSFFAFDGLFVIINGLMFAWLWPQLAKRGKMPSLYTKFGLGLSLMGLAFVYLHWLAGASTGTSLVGLLPMVLTYWFFALAELLIGPIGIAMVGNLTPHGWEGSFMGVWQLFIGIGAVSVVFLGRYTVIPTHGKPDNAYATLFGNVGVTIFIIGLTVLIGYFVGKRITRKPQIST